MRCKSFVVWVLILTLLLLGALSAMVAVVDPFFLLHCPGEAEVYENERYENPGMIRNLDYDTVLMGTSLVCNFRASWFDELTGGQTIKIAYRDGYLSDFDTALALAYRTHPDIRAVYFGLDANILTRSESGKTVQLPGWLYDNNPFNDVEYFLNKDVYIRCLSAFLQRRAGNAVPLDEAYFFGRDEEFTGGVAAASYPRPEQRSPEQPLDTFYDAVDENLAVVTRWAADHPETQFTIFFSPYSIMFWDKQDREGTLEAMLSALERAVEELLQYENISVHFFMGRVQTITDLNNYTDHVHFSRQIAGILSKWMMEDNFLLTRENYSGFMDQLADVVRNYDYDKLMAYYWK